MEKCTYSYYLFGHQNFSKNFVSVSRLKRFLFTYTCFDIGILLYVSDLEALQQYHQTQLGTTIIIHSYCQALTQTQHEQQGKMGTVGPCSLDIVSITLFGLARHRPCSKLRLKNLLIDMDFAPPPLHPLVGCPCA